MPVIDDDGNLFGVVNVVDVLAGLLLLAVVVAGAAFALQPEPAPTTPETATVNATLDLGAQPDYIVEAVNEGDTYEPDGSSELTITDVHLTPAGDGTRVLLRVRLEGVERGETITYADAPPRLGRALTVQTDAYTVKGTVRDAGGSNSLRTSTTEVVLSKTLPTARAEQLSVGDTYRVAGREVATVESVTRYATADPNKQRVFVGVSLQTLARDDRPRFAGTDVREGATLPVRTADYAFGGTVDRVGSTELRGEPATRTVTLRLENVDPALADAVSAGMTETSGDRTLARVTDVERENSTVVLTSDSGDIYEREHPVKQDLTLTVDLTVRETASGITFKGRTVKQGSAVTLDLGSVTVRLTVLSL